MWGDTCVSICLLFYFIFLVIYFVCSCYFIKFAIKFFQMLRRHIIFLILLIVPSGIWSQEHAKIKRYGITDGLMESYISCGLQDGYGYVWFSTRDGLVQYDGYRFKTYKAWPGDNCPLITNRIDYIQELPNHDILCYSNGEFYQFHRDKEIFEHLNDSLIHEATDIPHSEEYKQRIQQLDDYKNVSLKVRLIDKQGGIWIRSFRGLERIVFQQAPISNVKINTEEGDEYIRAIYLDSKKRIWLADKNNYVQLLNKDFQVIGYLNAQGQISKTKSRFGRTVYSVLEDSKGNIWLGTKPDGLFLLSPKGDGYQMRQFVYDEKDPYSISVSNIYEILEDSKHRYWVGTYGGGLNQMKISADGKVTFHNLKTAKNNYPNDICSNIHCMRIVRGDILLIGTHGGFLTCKLTDDISKMHFYLSQRDPANASSLSNNQVMGIAEDKEGTIYLATNGGGVDKILSKNLLSDHLEFEPYTSRNGLAADACKNIFFDKNGRLWIVTETALSTMDTKTNVISNYQRGLFQGGFQFEEPRPLCLSDGNIIFPTTQGYLMFNPQDIKKSHYVPEIRFTCKDTLRLSPDMKSFTLEYAALDYNRNEDIVYAYKVEGLDKDWHYTKENQIHFSNFPSGKHILHIKSTNGDGIWVDNERTLLIYRRAQFNETRYAWMLYGILLLAFLWLVYRIAKYIRQLEKEMTNYKLATSEQLEYMRSRIKELIQQDQHADMPSVEEQEKTPDDEFAEKAKAFVQGNLTNSELSVEDLASAMGVSNSLLYLKCKKVLGMPPKKFLMEERLNMAKQLIQDPNINVTEVAYRCGFSDPKYFSKCFKKATGVNPSEYKG